MLNKQGIRSAGQKRTMDRTRDQYSELIEGLDQPAMPFSSDTDAPIHPACLEAMMLANAGTAMPYGLDVASVRAAAQLAELFKAPSPAQLVFGGTGANLLALAAVTQRGAGVACTDIAHLHVDEAAACEARLGCKLLVLPNRDGKLDSMQLEEAIDASDPVHGPRFSAISLSIVTEVGTVYSPGELARIAEVAGRHGLSIQIDGARLGYGLVLYPELSHLFSQLHAEFGCPVSLVVGGTKFGMMHGEAIVSFGKNDPAVIANLARSLGQLPAKTRFIGAQFLALLEGDLWTQLAHHACDMAQRLSVGLAKWKELDIGLVESNSLYPRLEDDELATALKGWSNFAGWPSAGSQRYRLMTSWATSDIDVDRFVVAVDRLLEFRTLL